MRTKQTIIIIGATGKMGSAIAKRISKGNYRLLLNGRNCDRLKEVLNEIIKFNPAADTEIIDCSFEGCWEADIIILAVPVAAEKEVANKIKDVANQKIVMSISNLAGDTQINLKTFSEITEDEALQKALPHSKIIKAFNSISLKDITEANMNGVKKKMMIEGNDKDALQTISELVKVAGFFPVIANSLEVNNPKDN